VKHRRMLTLCIVASICMAFGLGFAAAQQTEEDKRQILMTDYKVTGTIDAVPGQTFPRSWGRLVNVFDVNTGKQYFVFEAEDGTIRNVRTVLDWKKHVIESADVITIGRK
jgi:hypothetical protein